MRQGDILLQYVASGAIIGWTLTKPYLQRKPAALIGMTRQAFAPVIPYRFFSGRLHVRFMAGEASESATAGVVTFAGYHLAISVQECRLSGRSPLGTKLEQCHNVIQRNPRTDVNKTFSRLQNLRVSVFVTGHAYFARQPHRQLGWVHNCAIPATGN